MDSTQTPPLSAIRRSKRRKPRPLPPSEVLASNLPCEIIYDILLRLPSKSLMRFKCVRKSWNSLISDPKFVSSHHNHSRNSTHRSKIVYRHRCERTRFWTVGFEDDENAHVENLHFPGNRGLDTLCSCDGLVMLKEYNSKFLYLWNPSVRKYVKPSDPSHFTSHFLNYDANGIGHGLYYDSSACDYVMVLIHENRYITYSVGEDSWGEIKVFPYSITSFTWGGCVNGAMYWVGKREIDFVDYFFANTLNSFPEDDYEYDMTTAHDIICFNPKEESFSVLPRPEIVDESCIIELAVLGGRLALYCNSYSNWSMKIWFWTGHDYHDPNSWGEFTIISNIPLLTCTWYRFRPIYHARENEILIEAHEGRFVLYDVKKEKFLEVEGAPFEGDYTTIPTYIDSMLLPGAGNNNRKWLTTEKRKRSCNAKLIK